MTGQTEVSLTAHVASNDGWIFDVFLTRLAAEIAFPKLSDLEQYLYRLDP